jgi:hypothetical protein
MYEKGVAEPYRHGIDNARARRLLWGLDQEGASNAQNFGVLDGREALPPRTLNFKANYQK